jgi:hypothetical protein
MLGSAGRSDHPEPANPVGALVVARSGPQWPVAVGVEGGELAVDVDGDGAEEVDVLVVAGPDAGQRLVVGQSASRQVGRLPGAGRLSTDRGRRVMC